MTIARLKHKNQLTLPAGIMKRLGAVPNDIFQVDVVENYIKLTPVRIEPKHNQAEADFIEKVFEAEKAMGKPLTPGKEFSNYVKKLTA
jgi:hypothetical protein